MTNLIVVRCTVSFKFLAVLVPRLVLMANLYPIIMDPSISLKKIMTGKVNIEKALQFYDVATANNSLTRA